MRKRKRPVAPEQVPGLDLTPMIDITFQIVVFLLVANDMVRQETEPVVLPVARNGAEVPPGGMDREILINLRAPERSGEPPRIVVKGKSYSSTGLLRLLQTVASRVPRLDGATGESSASVRVRSDHRVEWFHVQRILQQCAHPHVRIRRVRFATRLPSPDSP